MPKPAMLAGLGKTLHMEKILPVHTWARYVLLWLAVGVGVQGWGQFNTPTVNGTIAAGEYGIHNNGQNQQGNIFMTWDATNLFIGITNSNIDEGAVIYLDLSPIIPVNGGNNTDGTIIGFNYDGTNFDELPFRANRVLYFKNGYREYRSANEANGWTGPVSTTYGTYSNSGTTREISIPWTELGGLPATFNWFGFVTNPFGFVYNQVPENNFGGSISTNARYSWYYTVRTTANSNPINKPFAHASYTFNSIGDIINFGAINVWDFTMNTPGRSVTRTAGIGQPWTINGNLVVSQGILDFGTSTTPGTIGNLIQLGGTLTLSGTVGGDLHLNGNFAKTGGIFNCNTRQIRFIGAANQTYSSTATETINFLQNAKAGGTLNLTSSFNVPTTGNTILFDANTTSVIDPGVIITMSAGAIITANNAGSLVTVNGTINNAGTINGTAPTLLFSATGRYEHNHTTSSGVIPIATWNLNSICAIIGYTTWNGNAAVGSNWSQSFGNFIWNCPNQTASPNLAGLLTTIRGDFTMQSTGSSDLRFNVNTPLTPVLEIGGAYTHNGGTFNLNNGTSAPRIMLKGNFNLNGGEITRLVSGTTLTVIEFAGNINQSINVVSSTSISNQISFRCNNPAGITITGSLLINQGATFFRTQGAITGTIAYNQTASTLAYDGLSLTTSDVEWPSINGPINVTINTPDPANIVTLNADKDVTSATAGVLTLTSGKLSMANFNLAVIRPFAAALSAGTADSYIIQNGTGRLTRAIPVILAGTQNYAFPLGTVVGFTNINFSFTGTNGNTIARNLTVATNAGILNMFTPNTPPDYLSRYFTTSVDDLTGNYTYRVSSFGFIAGEETGDIDQIKISSYNSTTMLWTDIVTTSGNPLTSAAGTYTQVTAPLDGGHFSGRNSSALYTWLGTDNSSWTTTTNWNPAGFPSPTDRILVNDNTVPHNLVITDLRSINQATINGTGFVQVTGTGTLETSNLTLDGTGELELAAGATLTLNGNFTYNATATADFNCASTVNYASSTTQIIAPVQYGNLNAVGGNRTFVGSATTSICGNYTRGGNTTFQAGSTTIYNGANQQTIQGGANHNYANLLLNNSFGGYNLLSANTTVINNFTLNVISRLNIQTNTLTLGTSIVNVNGTLRSGGSITGTNITFGSTGVYEHNLNGGTIPTAAWDNGSVCEIIGVTGTIPAGLGQNFHHFRWNSAGQTTGILGLNSTLTSIAGNFEIVNANGNALSLANANPVTLTVGGNLNLQGGSLHLTVGAGVPILRIGGNLIIDAVRNISKGSGGGVGQIEFNGGLNQTITIPTTANIIGQVNFRINNPNGITIPNGSTLPINANASFFRRSGGITLVGTGNINYVATSSILEYDPVGTTVITTSAAEWPNAGHSRVRINSTSSNAVILHANREITSAGNIDFVAGRLALGNFNLTVQNNAVASVNNTTGYAETNGAGQLIRTILSSNNNIYNFPVGNGTNFTPVSYNFATNSLAGRQLGVRAVGVIHPNMLNAPPPVDYLNNRYWVTTLSDASGTYSYIPSYTYISGNIVGTEANVRLSRWNLSSWTNIAGSSIFGVSIISGTLSQTTGNLANGQWSGRGIKVPITYTWNVASNGAWTTNTNWNPVGVPGSEDIVQFTHAGNYEVTNVPSEITLQRMLLSGNGTTTLFAANAGTINLGGGTNPVLNVAAGTSLIISGNIASNWIILGGSTGTVSGNIRLSGTTGISAHTLQAESANGLTFASGSYFASGVLNTTNFSGNPFGDGTSGSVVFQSGSIFEQFDGSSPFATNGVCVFQTGSLFRYSDNQAITSPSFSGRTFADFEYNSNLIAGKSVIGIQAFTMDNLTIAQGTFNINMTDNPGHAIRGNITVNGGANLSFSPTTIGTVNLSGSALQTISGAGNITINANSTINVTNNGGGVQLEKNLTVTGGLLNVAANGIFRVPNENLITGTGTFILNNGGTLGIGSANGIATAATGNIRTTTRTFNAGGNFVYIGSGNQNTGNGLPATITGRLEVANTGGAANNIVSLTTIPTTTANLTLYSGILSLGAATNQLNISSGGTVVGVGGDFATGANGGILNFNGTGTFTGNCNPYNVHLSGGVNFGGGTVTIQDGGRLRINGGGFVNTFPPAYANGSLLQYHTNSPAINPYGRGLEWSALSGKGYPFHVQLSNNTHVDMGANGGTNTLRQSGGNLTIDAGSGFFMDYASNNMTQPVRILGEVNINGTLSLSNSNGGDFELQGSWYLSMGAIFNPRNREVRFNGSSLQLITGNQNTSFDFLRLNNPAGVNMERNTSAFFVTLQNGLFTPGAGRTLFIKPNGTISNSGFTGSLPNNSAGGTLHFEGAGTITASQTIGLAFWDVWLASTGTAQPLNFGSDAGVPTLVNTMTINSQRFLTNAPLYVAGSTIIYNSSGNYDRNVEWGTSSGRGYPFNVRIQNGTTVNMHNNPINNIIGIEGDLQLGHETNFGSLNFQNRAHRLFVKRDVIIGANTSGGNSSLTLGVLGSNGNAGDLEIGRNYERTVRGQIDFGDGLGRAVFFTSAIDGSIISPSPTTTETFPFVIVDKVNENTTLTLNCQVNITGKLTLTAGRVITTEDNILNIINPVPDDAGNGVAVALPDLGLGYVDGPMRRSVQNSSGAQKHLFPVGYFDGTNHFYKRMRMKELANGNGVFTVSYVRQKPPGGFPAYNFFQATLLGILADEYWNVERTSGSTTGKIVLLYSRPGANGWLGVDGTPINPPPNPVDNNDINVAVVKGTDPGAGPWNYNYTDESNSLFSNSGPEPEGRFYDDNGDVSSRMITTFGSFTLGFGLNTILEKLLPLQLHHFTATLHNGAGMLQWQIADANDLQHFEVEHSTNGERFSRLGTVPGNSGVQYSYLHSGIGAGVHYYRLKLVEKDGRSTYSKVVVLQVDVNQTIITGLLQNPIIGRQATVQVYSAKAQKAEATVIDMQGRLLFKTATPLLRGSNQARISTLPLPAGRYLLMFRTADGVSKTMPFIQK